jgi:hypothetical protein
MAYEQREMSGSMFVNNRKDKENQPDRQGSALIEGVEYWISGWIKEGQNGKWMSLAFKRKTPNPEAAPPPESNFPDIPF